MFQFGDLFKGSFSFMNQQPALEDKLSDQNLPLEDFLKDDEAISTIKFMGKNTKKYLNSEKIKKLIKLITEEPEIDDQLHGHKFPYVAFQILKSDCPFIAKRFILNEQEFHEEYPDSPEDEIDELGLDLDLDNDKENKEIDFDFKKKKIEFEKIYAQIEENFRNIRKSIDEDKRKKRSKDDFDRDGYKSENNNYEEDYEEYEEIKEDNVINDINSDENKNEKNSKDIEKEEHSKNNEINETENNNINKNDNIDKENNEEAKNIQIKENNKEEKQEQNNNAQNEENNKEENMEKEDTPIEENKKDESIEKTNVETKEKNKEENKDIKDVEAKEKNTEENMEKTDAETGENNKEENVGKKDGNENNNVIEKINEEDNTKEINNNTNITNQENKENIDIEEKKQDENKENKEISQDNIENKKEIIENNKENKDISTDNIVDKKEIVEDTDKKITQEKIEINQDNQEKENINSKKEKEIKLKNNEENKKEEETDINNEKKEEEIKKEKTEEIKDELKNDIKEEIKNELNNDIKESNDIKEQKEEKNKEDKVNDEESKEKEKDEKIENLEKENNTELKEEKMQNTEEKNNTELREEQIENLKSEENKGNSKMDKTDETIDVKENEIDPQNNQEKNDNSKEQINEVDKNEIKEKEIETNHEVNQEEEPNEEINNIIIDKTEEEKEKDKNIITTQENENMANIEDIDYDQENSLSVEGELDEEIKKKNNKKKKVYKNSQNNEFFDLLLNFVMTDKPELNYVLSGYFANVIISLLNTYPYKIIKYLYTQRKDALKKILFHSNQKAFSILSSKLLNIESYINSNSEQKQELNEFIKEIIPYRNELIKEIINSINLDGLAPHPPGTEGGEIENYPKKEVDIEAIFSLISGLIDENKLLAKEIIDKNYLSPHLFDILETDLYCDIDNKDNFDENKFNTRYNIYGLFIDLTSKFINIINTTYNLDMPMEFDFQNLKKPKKDLKFSDNLILSFGKIIKNNFLAKKPVFIVEKMSNIKYEGLGSLNLKIFDLVRRMIFFMKELPKQFDMLLIRNYFCQRSIEYFFKYQWNNIYQNKFIEFFNLYLINEEFHEELTNYYFKHLKLQDLLMDFFEVKSKENEVQKWQFEFKNGTKINSGIYPHIIDLMYKIQTYSGLEVFSEEEKRQLKIINLGEFEFSKDEKSRKLPQLIGIKNNLKEIFSKNEKWNSIFKNKILPVLKKYEGQLCPKKPIDDDETDIKNDYGSNSLLLQQMLNLIKRNNPIKRTSLPISRNDKNSTGTTSLNKDKKEKFSIREKLLSKGYKGRHIFDEDDDDDKKEKETENNYKKNINEEELDEKDKMFNDTNYWELKSELPEKIKKEVDKKTNIIFNYNPITGENEKNNEISEEDELLSIAMGLEQNEKMEKKKKIMYMLPAKLKPINLKTKSNPVQNIFINIANKNKNNKFEKIQNKKKDIINLFENETNNENEEHENEEENIIKKEEENIEENKKVENNDKNEDDKDKMFNDVNYWKSNNLLKEEEIENLINDL